MPEADHDGLLPKLKGTNSGLASEAGDGDAHRIAAVENPVEFASIAPVDASPCGTAVAP
jgi:hypothetical protein